MPEEDRNSRSPQPEDDSRGSPVQELERLSIHGRKSDNNKDANEAEANTHDARATSPLSPERLAINTVEDLKRACCIKEQEFNIAVQEKGEEDQETALEKLTAAQERVDKYRGICKKRYPTRLELYTWDEIEQRNRQYNMACRSMEGSSKEDHYVPKDLPVLQVVGSDKWHPNKAVHLSAEMFLRAFTKELKSCGLDLVQKYDTPEQQLRGKEACVHMKQKKGEKIATYVRRFYQRCIEAEFDQFDQVMIVILLCSLDTKTQAQNLCNVKFGPNYLKTQKLEAIVEYLAGLQLNDSDAEKRPRDDEDVEMQPAKRTSRSIHQVKDKTNFKHIKPCDFCGRPRANSNHRCNEFREAKGLAPLPDLPPAKKVNRTATIVDHDDIDDSLPYDGANFSAVDSSFCQKHKIKYSHVKGFIQLAAADKQVRRIGLTRPLDIWYNGRHIKRQLEVMNLANGKVASIGKNLFADLGIGYTGLAFTWKDAMEEEIEKEVNDEPIPNEAPAGTKEEQEIFRELIEPSLKRNSQIPKDALCPFPEAVISIPTPENVVCYRRQYTIAYEQRPIVQEAINKWLTEGTITEVPADADNRWNSPLTLAPKKDSQGKMIGHRPCLDPRLINEHLTDDKHRIPLITEIFDQLAGSKVYTTLDLASAFHRFPIKPEDRHKTAFTAPDGMRYMFKGCPFGLKPISSKFQRVMDKLFRDLPYVTTFVDDIIVFSKSKRDHVQHVTIVIDRLTEANLILQLKK
ncbi:hypothetical protein O0I10_012518 [Lichtheimia ornata]|uniref:Reverse transcriptase domain-containing protein n=1 Tax=Lichtheimia ornata TaxID=688661 RepID=A0AAD7URJ5_9FUNG|nr:uncharacterized protein O0I10_012518 [Lichtheimia ornata]KAJ8651910.1 hypothetical protein O0I10_012518 [Lichtheimia ornata]